MDDLDPGLLAAARHAAVQTAHDAVLPGDGLGQIELGASTEMPSGLLAAAMCAGFSNSSAAWISALEGMQPTLRQVPPACRLDDDGVDAELSGADGADIAAGTGADDEQLAGTMSFMGSAFAENQRGVSSSALRPLDEDAASQPSMTR
jgi:hypothetical protein